MKFSIPLLKSVALMLLAAAFTWAAEADAVPAENSQSVVSEQLAKDSAMIKELEAEVILRDSIMAVRDSSCIAEKDSLRSAMAMGNAMSDSWKQSYEMMKENHSACTQALNAAQNANEEKAEEVETAKSNGTTAAVASFAGGVGIGMLLFWLIFE